MLEYDYSCCVAVIKPNNIKKVIEEIKSYKSDLVNEVKDVMVITRENDYIEECKKSDIPYSFDFRTDIFVVNYTFELNLEFDQNLYDDEFDMIEDKIDLISEECSNIECILVEYEEFKG